MAARFAVFMLAFALAAAPVPAEAYVCIGPDQTALPLVGVPAPTNTHVWLFVSKFFHEVGCAKPPCQGRFVVRTAAGDPSAEEVAIASTRETTNGDVTAIEIVPARELPSMRAFETWWVPRGPGPPRFMSAFRTGHSSDRTTPSALRVGRASHISAKSLALGEPNTEQIVVEGEPAMDDGAPAPLYAVWLGPAGGRAPDAVIARTQIARDELYRPRVLVVGTGAGCFASFTVSRALEEKTLVVRALDLAGNLGPPAEFIVTRP